MKLRLLEMPVGIAASRTLQVHITQFQEGVIMHCSDGSIDNRYVFDFLCLMDLQQKLTRAIKTNRMKGIVLFCEAEDRGVENKTILDASILLEVYQKLTQYLQFRLSGSSQSPGIPTIQLH